jgi:hypothetical protein
MFGGGTSKHAKCASCSFVHKDLIFNQFIHVRLQVLIPKVRNSFRKLTYYELLDHWKFVHLTNNFTVQKVNEEVKQMLNLYVIVKKEVHGHMKSY